MTFQVRHIFTAILILLLNASLAIGASVSVEPSGNGVFIIKGNNMDRVAGIELILNYDTSTLASPTVTQGNLISGAMFAANTNNPGSIRIAVISAKIFSGSGPIASVSFATYKGVPAVTISSSRMIDSKGLPLTSGDFSSSATTGFISSPGVPFSQPSSMSTAAIVTGLPSSSVTVSSTPTATVSTGATPTASVTTALLPATTTPTASVPTSTYLGTVSMPLDAGHKNDTNRADNSGESVQFTEPAVVKPMDTPVEIKHVSEQQKPVIAKITTYKGTLESFREYSGEKSPAILIALFNKKIAPNIRQEPAIVLSDGKTPVKIVVELKGNGEKSPNFALNGAKLVSLNKDDDSFTWIVETLPQANMMQASLTILTDIDIIEYPFTVTPLVEKVSPAEADFTAFLKDSAAATPKCDLNNDGKHDYLDEYIYTANYLITKDATGKTKK